jgi:glycosidase
MVDRFHDGMQREIMFGDPYYRYEKEELMRPHGGTFQGIQSQLSYIKNLGCTTIWLSPVFENYEESYHGYAIRNFLNTDSRFGTIEELKALVAEAHKIGIRVVLDVVINHTANTWSYEKENPSYTGAPQRFGHWRDAYYPLPKELRNPDYYKKAGAIINWDDYPETQEGDIFELKKIITDTSPIGREVLDILVKIYSFWIKETNVDGFRLDTVKHLTPSAVAIFCTKIREYCHYLGKDSFLIFGEAVGDYSLMSHYLRTVKTQEGWMSGLDAALDFPLHFILDDLVKGKRPASDLYKLYRAQTRMLAKLNKKSSDLMVFADNHDQIGQEHKSRIAYEAEEDQIVATIGLLYFLYGIPCLYYGTEQLLDGNGTHDCWIREPMFKKHENKSFHNEENSLYKKIATLASLREKMQLFREAEVELDLLSVNGGPFISCEHTNEIIYWSKKVFGEKMILLYNPKKGQKQSVCAKLSPNWARITDRFECVYGNLGAIKVEEREHCGYINIDLNPLQFVILK